MYGTHDVYNSPHSAAPAGLSAVFGLIEDDEFGLFKKLRAKHQTKRIARIQGKLKTLLDKKKFKKAQKHAGKLSNAVKKLEKVDEDYEPSAETEAWIEFSEDGDVEDLLAALSGVSITGKATGFVPSTVMPQAYVPSGAPPVPSRPRRLRPGTRPQGYTRWRRGSKMRWLSHHPRAASVRHHADPRPGGRAASAGRGYGPMGPRHPMMQRPGGSRRARLGSRARSQMPTSFGGLIGIDAFHVIEDPSGFTRKNLFFEAIGNEAAEDVEIFGLDFDEEFGSKKGKLRKAAKAERKAAIAVAKSNLAAAKVKSFGYHGDDEYGVFKKRRRGLTGHEATGVRYSPLASKKLNQRLKTAKAKVTRAHAIGDTDAANAWLGEYNAIAAKMAEMRAMPTVETVVQARILEQVPLFQTSTAGKEERDMSDEEVLEDIFPPASSVPPRGRWSFAQDSQFDLDAASLPNA